MKGLNLVTLEIPPWYIINSSDSLDEFDKFDMKTHSTIYMIKSTLCNSTYNYRSLHRSRTGGRSSYEYSGLGRAGPVSQVPWAG